MRFDCSVDEIYLNRELPIINPLEGFFLIQKEIPRLILNTFTDRNIDINGPILVDLKDRFINLGEIDPYCDMVLYKVDRVIADNGDLIAE